MRKLSSIAAFCFLITFTSMRGFAQTKPEGNMDLLWRKLQTSVERIDNEFDGILGVAIRDLTDGRLLQYHGDQVLPTASTIKIAVLAELYRQAGRAGNGAAGKADLDRVYTVQTEDLVGGTGVMNGFTAGTTRLTYQDLAYLMIVLSDNSATNVLIDHIGMNSVNRMFDNLGLRNSRLRRKQMDLRAALEGRENTSTPVELVSLLEAVYKGSLLGEGTKPFLTLLKVPKDSYLSRMLPSNVAIANKPGILDGVRVDAGIVYAGNRPFAIAVMTAYDRNGPEAERVIGRIALEAYGYFERVGRASEYGRFLSPSL